MTIKEIDNFNIDGEDTEIVKDFAYFGSVINLNENYGHEIKNRLRLEGQQWKNLERSSRVKMCHWRQKLKSFTLLCPQLLCQMTKLNSEEG